ncbi:MAG TPA: steroid delta-isomerase, partial [Phycisphaerales bacterium]|nr:steroid delta-isomerase [Phycisphaerales bacterium]
MKEIEALARRQLEAYNASDLDAFCDCYHDRVEVWNDL